MLGRGQPGTSAGLNRRIEMSSAPSLAASVTLPDRSTAAEALWQVGPAEQL